MAAVSMSVAPLTCAAQNRVPSPTASFSPLTCAAHNRALARPRGGGVRVNASLKEKAVTGLTAAALTASMVVPDVASAAESGGLSPSLKNFLLSIAAGGVVLTAIIGAVVGVSNFDPVNRT